MAQNTALRVSIPINNGQLSGPGCANNWHVLKIKSPNCYTETCEMAVCNSKNHVVLSSLQLHFPPANVPNLKSALEQTRKKEV